MAETNTSKVSSWMFLLGALLLLMGLYGFFRTVHINYRQVPYPAAGVFPATFILPGVTTYYSRESECEPYPQLYFDIDNMGKQVSREATEDEIRVQEENKARCINGFEEDRAKQKQRDKNQVGFLVFVGAGLILSRRFIE